MPSLSWNRARAAHLLRRAGFGGLPEEIDRAVALGREAAVDELVDFERVPLDPLNAVLSRFDFDLTTWYPQGADPRGLQFVRLLIWWAMRMTHTPRPLEERMTLFWHGHFTVSNAKLDSPWMLLQQNQLFRTRGLGRFRDFLIAVSTGPAMLFWLDNVANVKDAPNENFARELMELFTMGIGHYTQQDVTEAARALTGWTVTGDRDVDFAFVFEPSTHDDGLKTFLGRAGYYRGEDVCSIIAARPETAEFMTRKLARFFIGRDPRPVLARSLVDAWFASDGEIRTIVRRILLSDEFDQSADEGEMIKSPIEFLVGAFRGLGARDEIANGDLQATTGQVVWDHGGALGQFLFVAPNVAGWPGGRAWINTGSYLGRMFAVARLVWGDLSDRWDIDRFFGGRSFSNADALIDFIADRLTMVPPSEVSRRSLRDYLTSAGSFAWTADSPTRWGRGALSLLMSSPEYLLQ